MTKIVAKSPYKIMSTVPFKAYHEREFGVMKSSVCAETGEVLDAKCLFCVHFPKEPLHSSSRKRKATSNVKYFKRPFRVANYRSHLRQHMSQWEEYKNLSNEQKDRYFHSLLPPNHHTNTNTNDVKSILSHEQQQHVVSLAPHRQLAPMDFIIDRSIVDAILNELMFDPLDEDQDMTSQEQVLLSLFQCNSDTNTYTVTIRNPLQFDLIQRYLACGASFKLILHILNCSKDSVLYPQVEMHKIGWKRVTFCNNI